MGYTFVKDAKGFSGVAKVYRNTEGRHVVVSRAYTFDRGDETMIFEWSTATDSIADWIDLYAGYGETHEEALANSSL